MFNFEKSGLSPGRKGARGKQGGKGKRRRSQKNEPLIPQPVAETAGAVPCHICGCPVDRKRMHFHMVRFHGASLRPT